jgi:hypothetical protein
MFDKFNDVQFRLILILCLIAIAFMLIFSGCQSSPDKADYDFKECFQDADCMYRNKDNDDKSACSVYKDACANKYKEACLKQRLEYCRDNKFESMTQNECRLYLNQK